MTLVNAAELDTSPPEWLVGDNEGSGEPGILPLAGTGFGWGKRTAGKSLLLGIKLGLAVANGVRFMNYPVVKSRVVYCIGEGLYDLGVRKQAELAQHAADDRQAIEAVRAREGDAAAEAFAASLPAYTDENLFVITEPFQLQVAAGSGEPHKSLHQAISAIAQLMPTDDEDDPDYDPDALPLGLVILDALADFTSLSLSNDASANRIVAAMKLMARKLNCVILAIAHPTAKGDKMLGADRLGNSADFVLVIEPDEAAAPGAPQTATVHCEKNKYGARFDDFGYEIVPVRWDQPATDEWGDEIEGADPVTVRSATVRLLEQDTLAERPAARTRPAAELPEIRTPNIRAKRNGLKRTGPRPERPATASAGAAAAGASTATVTGPTLRAAGSVAAQPAMLDRAGMVRAMLADQCPDCSRPGGMGCDPKMGGSEVLPLGRTPAGPLWVHEDRIMTAALTAADPEAFLADAITIAAKAVA